MSTQNLNVILLKNRVFGDVIIWGSQNEFSLDVRWALNPMTAVLIEKRKGYLVTETFREEDWVQKEADIGVIRLQTKKQAPPEASRSKEGFLPRTFGGYGPGSTMI